MGFLATAYLISNVLDIILVVLITILLVRQYLHSGHSIVLYLAIGLFLGALGWAPSVIATYLQYQGPDQFSIIFWVLSFVSSVLFTYLFMFMILFFEYFSVKEQSYRIKIVFLLSGAALMLALISFFQKDTSIIMEVIIYQDLILYSWGPMAALVNFTSFVCFAIFSGRALYRSRKNAINETQLRQVNLMFAGFGIMGSLVLLGIVGSILYFRFDLILAYIWIVFIVQRLLLSVSLALIAFGYLSPNQIMYISPQRLETLLVIHKSGIPLFRYDFDEIHASTDSSLVSGAITAISAIMNEAFNTTSDLQTINFQDKHLVLEFEGDIACILITPHITPFLRESTTKFTKSFVDTYQRELQQDNYTDTGVFGEADKLVLESFGLAE